MKIITELILKAWRNKHTSASGLVLFAAEACAVIWPQYQVKFHALAALAITYGLIQAKDSDKPQPPKDPNAPTN